MGGEIIQSLWFKMKKNSATQKLHSYGFIKLWVYFRSNLERLEK
jgi:hypothetical protein